MASSIQFTDILIALEPTGFSSPDASIVLGLVATGFITTMAGLFAYAYKDRVLSFKRRNQELATLLGTLRKQYPEKIDDATIWDQEIAPQIEKLEWMRDGWQGYRDQCWQRDSHIASLSHADVHFANIEPPASGFSKQIAGILTSIGILGTFIGITVGLGQIGADMSGGSSEDMQNAMSSLISSLGVSFRTSIWGLISSMVITAITNSQISQLEKTRLAWLHWLDNTMPQKSERALLAEQTSLMAQQVASTKTVGESIGKSLGQTLTKAFGQLQSSMDKMTESIANQQQEGLDALVQQFMRQMQNTMNADFSALGTALQEMVSSNDRFQHSMSQLVDHLQKATQNQGTSAQQMQDALANAARSIAEMQGSFSGLSSVSSNIQDAAVAMQKILEQQMQASNQQQQTIGNMMNGMNDQANQMLANQEEIGKAGAAITEKFGSLADALENLIVWHNRVKDGLGQQIGALQQTISAQEAVQRKMEEERQAALQIVQRLATTQANLGPAAKSIAGAGDSVKKASDSLFSTEKALRQLISAVTDATTDMNDRQIQTLDRYQAIYNLLQKLS